MKIAEKKKCKEARKALAQKELNDFRASLPMEEKYFSELFHYLEKTLQKTPCDHTLRGITRFLAEKKVSDPEKVITWLASHALPFGITSMEQEPRKMGNQIQMEAH